MNLTAGPLTLQFEPHSGFVRTVRFGEAEALRSIYGAVRDRNWGTVAPQITDLEIEEGPDSFALSFVAQCQEGDIDFVWEGRIAGECNGTLRYEFEGVANSDFLRGRIGLCVLHPVLECAGKSCRVTHADGTVTDGEFPFFISPHQPFFEMQGIAYEIAPGVMAEVRFEGDIFEMEDQRNWTDGSYKTYSTPLRIPYPVEVKRGDRVRQSVTLTLHAALPLSPAVVADETQASEVKVDFHASDSAYSLPCIGLGIPEGALEISERATERLRELSLSHLRWDVDFVVPDLKSEMESVMAQARAIGAELEIALFLSDAALGELRTFAALLNEVSPPVAWILVFHKQEKSTAEPWVRLAKAVLYECVPDVPIGAGTNAYFTELNRERPPVAACDFITYSMNPQVHSFDNRTLIEALDGQGWTLKSAHQIAGEKPVVVSPVTLKPRFNPNATAATLTAADALPDFVDDRQPSLFAAAWTLGSILQMIENQVLSVTYYETVGWRGVMESEAGSPMPDLFHSVPGAVFPVYHVFADIGEWKDATVSIPKVSHSDKVVACVMQRGEQVRILLANLSAETQNVRLTGIPPLSLLVRHMDAGNLVDVTETPEAFRTEPGAIYSTKTDNSVVLPPHAYLCLTSG